MVRVRVVLPAIPPLAIAPGDTITTRAGTATVTRIEWLGLEPVI